MDRLKDKVVIITGASSGMGATAAQLFASEGAKVVLAARRAEQLQETADKIHAAGGECTVVPSDIASDADCAKLVNTAVETYGRLDGLVNNAGVLEKGLKPIDRFTDEDYDKVLAINTKGTMNCIRAAASELCKTQGSIVNIASVAGLKGCGGAVYVASKGAIVGITKHTALRFVSKGLRCNAICPSTVITPMTTGSSVQDIDADMIGEMSKHMDLKIHPCMPDDVAKIMLFLISDDSRALTGQALVADFGSTL